MKEVMDLIPKDNITRIVEHHSKTDEGFKAAIAYMKSSEWTDLLDTIRNTREWKIFRSTIEMITGFDIETLSKCTRGFTENIHIDFDRNNTTKRSLRSFMIDVEQTIPVDTILKIFYKDLIDTGVFKNTIEQFKTDNFRKIIEDLLAVPEVKKFLMELENMDLNIKSIYVMLQSFLGWPKIKDESFNI